MNEYDKSLVTLIIEGALIGLSKLLVSNERLTLRLITGRTLLGSATSMLAGVALGYYPALPSIAVIGLGSALGILGVQYLEIWLRHRADQIGGK